MVERKALFWTNCHRTTTIQPLKRSSRLTCGPEKQVCRKVAAVIFLAFSRELIVRKIIGPVLSRRSKHLVALEGSAAMSARNEFNFVRIRCDDYGAAGGQTINQPSIGCNSKHSDAH